MAVFEWLAYRLLLGARKAVSDHKRVMLAQGDATLLP